MLKNNLAKKILIIVTEKPYNDTSAPTPLIPDCYNPPSSDNNELPSKENLQEGNQITQSEPVIMNHNLIIIMIMIIILFKNLIIYNQSKEENIDGVKIQWN